MKKVCHFSSSHRTDDPRIYHKECRSLVQAGYDVTYVTPGESFVKDGIRVIGVERPKSLYAWSIRILKTSPAVYKKAVQLDADIYHFHEPELIPYGLKLKKRNKTVIFDIHENITALILETPHIPHGISFIRKPLQFIFNLYIKSAISKFDAIINVSPNSNIALNKISKKHAIISNYPIINEEQITIESKKSVKYNNTIGFAGNIEGYKTKMLISAMEQCSNANLLLMGNATDKYIDELKGLPAWGRVIYKGLLSFDDAIGELSKCSMAAIILDYSVNTFGKMGTMGNTKLFETMSLGLPIIVTDFVLYRDIVEAYECGILVNPNDQQSIADAIKFFIDNPNEVERMGANARRVIYDKYNWRICENMLLKLYADLERK